VTPKRQRWLIGSGIAAVVTILAISVVARIPFSSKVLSERVTETLADRLDAEVELGGLTLRAFPTLHAVGTGLIIRHKGRTDVPPLITIKSFSMHTSLMSAWRRHVEHVRLEGLEIQIPPGEDRDGLERPAARTGAHLFKGPPVIVDQLVADDAKLVIIPRDRSRLHRTWVMHRLRVRNVAVDTEMPFETTLTNAVPPGEIESAGTFGPWHRDDPGHTPVEGRFSFDHADLGVFKGISGTLASTGTYAGRLETIHAIGEADVPDFKVDIAEHAVPLHASYDAVIDGTNGDTRLDRVDAKFLSTSLTASGGIYDVEGVKGRDVKMAVVIDSGRLEDVMRLVVNSDTPPMTGALRLQANFVIPASEVDVVDKLRLEGRFSIGGGRFTNPGVQRRINEMSLRASGKLAMVKNQPNPPAHVASDFQGRFELRDGVLRIPTLVFDIPGAALKLSGQYALRRETIAFTGNLYMDAKVSQTVTGWRSMLLKIADPLFRENGQTVVPVKITGTRSAPAFGMDVGRIFKKG
jgi:AsmA-like C-terminal region